MSQQELSDLIYGELQQEFTNTKKRLNYPASKYNQDLAKKLSTAIFEYLDTTYWQRIVTYVDQRISEVQSLARQAQQTAELANTRAMTPGPPGPPGPRGDQGPRGESPPPPEPTTITT